MKNEHEKLNLLLTPVQNRSLCFQYQFSLGYIFVYSDMGYSYTQREEFKSVILISLSLSDSLLVLIRVTVYPNTGGQKQLWYCSQLTFICCSLLQTTNIFQLFLKSNEYQQVKHSGRSWAVPGVEKKSSPDFSSSNFSISYCSF